MSATFAGPRPDPVNASEACRYCGAALHIGTQPLHDTRFGIAQSYFHAYCPVCDLQQTCPRLSDADLKALYEQYYNFGGEAKTVRYSKWRERFLFSRFYALWTVIDGDISFHHVKGSGRLLDVGCNEGRGLLFYRHNGFAAEGLELNPAAAAAARQRGFTVSTEALESFTPEHRYNVIILSNVLEHSQEPQTMLAHVRRLLLPGGEVWISCPNARSWMRPLFRTRWVNWHIPFHTVHFSPGTLQTVLQASGFRDVRIRQETPALWVASSLIVALFARHGRPTRQLRSTFWVGGLTLLTRLFAFPVLSLANHTGHGDCLVIRAVHD